MITIRVRYGAANSVEKQFPDGTTVGAVIRSAQIKAALGYGDNVRPMIDRVAQSLDAPLANGDTIELESAANAKA